VDRWDRREYQLIDLLTKPEGNVTVTDAANVDHVLPSFLQLNNDVTKMTDALTGAVAEARDINSQSLGFANAAHDSAIEAEASAKAAADSAASLVAARDAAATSAAQAATSASIASGHKDAAKESKDAAAASQAAAKASADAASMSKDNAGFSAAAAQNYRDDANLARDMASAYANAPVNSEVSPGRYSAFHWAEQARLVAVGALIYKGAWDASGGTLPPAPKLGDFYFISKAGTVGGIAYKNGDMAVFDGTVWERIDNQQAVTTVAGRTGAVVLTIADIASLQSALDAKLTNGQPYSVNSQAGNGSITYRNVAGTLPRYYVAHDDNNWNLCTADDAGVFRNVRLAIPRDSASPILIDGAKAWHAGNFNPTTKADLAGATFTGAVVVNNNSLRASGWGGVTTDGVVYFGGADSYVYKGGSNFSFKNEQGGFTATLSSGGTIWTSNSVTPLDKNTGGVVSGKMDYNGQVNCWAGFHSIGSTTAFNGQGAYVGWNRNYRGGNGETDFINHKGGGTGGWAFFNTDGNSYWELANIDGNGQIWANSNVVAAGNVQSNNGYFLGAGPHAVVGPQNAGGTVYLRPNGAFNGAGEFRVGGNGDATCSAWVYANNFKLNSDKRLKRRAVLLDARNELDRIKRLIPRRYIKAGKVEYGFFAQEFDDAYPTMVTVGEGPAGPDTHTISQMELIAPIVAVLKDLDRRLTEAGL